MVMYELIQGVFGRPKRSPIVTLARLNRALARVISELSEHGVWDAHMQAVDVYLVPFDWACYGWQWYGSTGDICIPSIGLAKLRDHWFGRHTSLAYVLRHEYGHALADTHRGLFRSSRFGAIFGTAHEDEMTSFEYDPSFHVSEYAATNASEDFAEVFALYLRHGGRLPRDHYTKPKQAKWRFVRDVCSAVQLRRRRWSRQ
jgi:hypothetical protein